MDEDEYYNGEVTQEQIQEAKEEVMKREGIKNEKDILVRSIIVEIRKTKGFELLGARTPGSFSDDV